VVDGIFAGQRTLDATATVLRDDQTQAHLLVHATLPMIDERPAIALLSLTDVTPLKQAQAELERADRRKNEFLAMIVHELRNPLAPIRYAAELLRETGQRHDLCDPVGQRPGKAGPPAGDLDRRPAGPVPCSA
jgi:signal transduction histidine kinase